MGTPIQPPDPNGYGDDCSTCTPAIFAAGETPYRLEAVFHNVTACPPFPAPLCDVPISIYQSPVAACQWQRNFAHAVRDWTIQLDLSIGELKLTILNSTPYMSFYALASACSLGVYTNELSCPGPAGEGGTAWILGATPAHITELALKMNFQPDAKGLYDDFQAADPDQRCIRLTGRVSQGSCLFLFEP